MAKKGITKSEIESKGGYIVLAIGAFFIADYAKVWLNTTFPNAHPLLLGGVIVAGALYFFKYK